MLRQAKVFWPGAVLPSMGALALIALLGGALSACQSTNALAAANTRDQKAYAVYGTFVVIEEQAATLVTSPATPAALRAAIRSADAKAKPTADTLKKALVQYDAAFAAVKAGASSDTALGVAAANLDLWITQATTDVNTLVNIVKGNAPPQGVAP